MKTIHAVERAAQRTKAGAWSSDSATWRLICRRYLPALGAFNLLWELVQLPLYTLWTEAPAADIAFAVMHCTAGDLLIGAGALFAALITTRAGVLREWRWLRIGAVAVVFGLGYTAFSEWMNAVANANWAYSEWMPVLPVVPIGLSPLLQWVLLPPAALALSRRLTFQTPSLAHGQRELGEPS